MHLEEFSQGNSFFHGIDPRIKFIVFIPLVFIVAVSRGTGIGLFSLLLAAVFIITAKIPPGPLLKRLLVVNIFVLFLWFTIPFSIKGQGLFSLGSVVASREGILYTLSITLKANAIFLFTVSILGTSEVFSLAHALYHLRVPRKLIYLFFFFYRYISVLHREYDSLVAALKVRGFTPKTNHHTYRTYAYLIGMLFIRSYERSQRIYNALLLRGFKGSFPLIPHFQLERRDIFFAFFVYGIIGVLLLWTIV